MRNVSTKFNHTRLKQRAKEGKFPGTQDHPPLKNQVQRQKDIELQV